MLDAFRIPAHHQGCFQFKVQAQRQTDLCRPQSKSLNNALGKSGRPVEVFADAVSVRKAIEALPPSPEHMFWFEYNFLYVLAGGGRAEKTALGDHSPAGYVQRARFYAVSAEGRLNYSKNVASYIVFLAENTGLATKERCAAAGKLLAGYGSLDAMLNDVSR